MVRFHIGLITGRATQLLPQRLDAFNGGIVVRAANRH